LVRALVAEQVAPSKPSRRVSPSLRERETTPAAAQSPGAMPTLRMTSLSIVFGADSALALDLHFMSAAR
jgi:hypothetical protein